MGEGRPRWDLGVSGFGEERRRWQWRVNDHSLVVRVLVFLITLHSEFRVFISIQSVETRYLRAKCDVQNI